MAVIAPATAAPTLCNFRLRQPLKLATTKLVGSANFSANTRKLSSNARVRRKSSIQASNSEKEQQGSNTRNDNGLSQEDWSYLWKLGAGSVAGAAAIKYGSIIFPEITRPNLLQALVMISTPVIVAIVLLFKQSGSD